MLLTLTTTHEPATDLGFLLHKHPERAQAFGVATGTAHVFYPVARPDECTAALLLDVDPLGLARDRHYVNDRPYAAGSMLAVALGAVFKTAMNGRCDARPELAAGTIPLRVRIPALPCRGGGELAGRLFEPLGWRVEATPVPLDPKFPAWGDSRYLDLTLSGELRLAEALRHLCVLMPVLDNAKHYWVSEDEVAKLLRAGDGWLAAHPERNLISQRYLLHRKAYVASALAALAEADDATTDELDDALAEPVVTELPDKPEPLSAQRRGSVLSVLRAGGARRILDLGCGGGALLADLVKEPSFTEIVGVDVSARALAVAHRKLHRFLPAHHPPTASPAEREHIAKRVSLRQSALTYVDPSLAGYDAAVLMEVIEHIDPERLPALERSVFGAARPGTVVVTTPNVEYNGQFPTLPAGSMRHPDHRFEWTRAQFRDWAAGVARRTGYSVRHLPVGPEHPEHGPPTQLAVFSRAAEST